MSQEPAPLIITCPCGQKMKVPANASGKTFKCVKCGAHVVAGAPGAPAPAPAEPPPAPQPPNALEPLGQLLVQAGCITPPQLDEALGVQRRDGGKTFEILVRLGYLEKARLHEILSKQPGVAAIDLARVTIDRELTKLVPREIALSQLVLPIDQLGKLLTVAMACPLDITTITDIEKTTGLKVKAMLCRYDDIQAAVTKQYPEDGGVEGELPTFQLPAGYDLGPKDDVGDKLGRLEDLHYRTEVLDQALALAKDPTTSLGAILECVSKDPAFAAAILRTANSVVFGMPGQVDSLVLGLTLLGRDGLGGLVSRCKKVNLAPQKNLAPLYDRAQAAATTAAMLARATGRVGREVAYTAGLLHGVGSFAIASASAQRFGRMRTDSPPPALAAEEKAAFGLGHNEAAQALLKRWRYPESLVESIGCYLSPENAPKHGALAGLVRAAATEDAAQAAVAAGAKPEAVTRAQREEEKLRETLRATKY